MGDVGIMMAREGAFGDAMCKTCIDRLPSPVRGYTFVLSSSILSPQEEDKRSSLPREG